jgi:hypothetical protein
MEEEGREEREWKREYYFFMVFGLQGRKEKHGVWVAR